MEHEIKDSLHFWISLNISNIEGDPAVLSDILNVKPEKLSYKGSQNKELNIKIGKDVPRSNMWTWDTKYITDHSDLDSHIAEFIKTFGDKREAIKELSKESKIIITIWINREDARPKCFFEKEFIEFLCFTGVQFQIDCA